MDTTWFAVDTRGRIGAFSTGEGGAVPHAGAGEENATPVDVFAHLPVADDGTRPIPVDGGPLAAVCPAERVGELIAGQRKTLVGVDEIMNVAVVTSDTSIARRLGQVGEPFGPVTPLKLQGTPTVLFFSTCNGAELQSAIDAGTVTAISPPAEHFKKHDEDWDYFNWFVPYVGLYDFICDSQDALPFTNKAAPVAAISAADLGALPGKTPIVDLSAHDFDAIAALQPVPLTPCASWGAWWWGADGSLHLGQGRDEGDLSGAVRPADDPDRLRLAIRPKGVPEPEYDYSDEYEDDPEGWATRAGQEPPSLDDGPENGDADGASRRPSGGPAGGRPLDWIRKLLGFNGR